MKSSSRLTWIVVRDSLEETKNGYTKNRWPFTVWMNDKEFFTTEGSPDGTRIDKTFEPGTLQPGWNTVWWEGHGEGTYWGGVDFHKLEVIDRPHSTILLIK